MPIKNLSIPLALFLAYSASCRGDVLAEAEDRTRFAVQAFQVEGNTLVSTEALQLRLSSLLGEGRTVEDLEEARQVITRAYQEAGRPLVSVGLPREFGAEGVVRLKVIEIPLREIQVQGNFRLTADQIRARIPALTENESPAMDRIALQLALANDNPALELRLDFLPRSDFAADATIQVKELPPVSFVVSVDNTGTKETGRTRLGFSITDADLTGHGDISTLTYVRSPERADRVHQVAASYLWPLPAFGDSLIFSGSYSDVNAGRVGDAFNVAGRGSSIAMRYQHNIVRTLAHRHSLEAGIESRHYRNIVDFSGTDLGLEVSSRPLALSYNLSDQQGSVQWSGNLSYIHNLPGGEHNNDLAYANGRIGAKADWSVWRASGRTSVRLPAGVVGQMSGEAQYTENPLISGEQFGVGGARSVRGFEERTIAGDRGWRLGAEILTPNIGDLGRLALFTDRGAQDRISPQPGEIAGQIISSWGLGWRYNRMNFTAIADWAQVMDGIPTVGRGHQKLHLQTTLQF